MSLNTPYYSALSSWYNETFAKHLWDNVEKFLPEDTEEEAEIKADKLKRIFVFSQKIGDPRLVYDCGDIVDVQECFRPDFEKWCRKKGIPEEQYKKQAAFYSRTVLKRFHLTIDDISRIDYIKFKVDYPEDYQI